MTAMTDMDAIESWPIAEVIPYPENHKKHSQAQVKILAASIADQGLNDPITVDRDGVIISGHGRLEAMKSLGWTHVPVRCLRALSKEQADKLRIAANKTASTEYDYDVLQRELQRLSAGGASLTDIGLDDKELQMMLDDVGDIDMDTIAGDIADEVEDFEEESRRAATTIAAGEMPISNMFGIKKVPLTAKKIGVAYIAEAEKRHAPLKGFDAVLAAMERYADGR